jgi:hypothetical protein
MEKRIKYTCTGRPLPDGRRAGCGHNITDLIENVPFDGEVHTLECPRCGNIFTVRRAPEEALETAATEE